MTESLPFIAVGAVLVACVALGILAVMLSRSRSAAAPQAALMDQLAHDQSEAAARLEAMIGLLAKGQSQLQHAVNERLAVIDSAQKNITALASQVTSLQNVLANKQSRGAFGQGRMEAIIEDSLPKGSYEFQATLSNRTRPDCCVFLPDSRPLVIDAKFPLEAVTAYRDAKTDDGRKAAAQRLRADVGKHVGDIAGKYLIPGETQEMAFMFVPSESVYAELHEDFDDVVQKAFRAKIVIVSPSLLMLAVQLVRQSQRDARMREAADQIRDEVGRLIKDVGLLGDRIRKLQNHFSQANEDVRQSLISVEKIEGRGERILEVEFGGETSANSNLIAETVRKLEAGE